MGKTKMTICSPGNMERKLIYRVPDSPGGLFEFGTRLIVREKEALVIFRHDTALDSFGPGRHTMSAISCPRLDETLNPFFPEDKFDAEIYFISTRKFADIEWGTPSSILVSDPTSPIPLLRATGTYSFRVTSPNAFVQEFARRGQHSYRQYRELLHHLRNIILSVLTDSIHRMATGGKSSQEIIGSPQAVARSVMRNAKSEFNALGIDLKSFHVLNIFPSPSTAEELAGLGITQGTSIDPRNSSSSTSKGSAEMDRETNMESGPPIYERTDIETSNAKITPILFLAADPSDLSRLRLGEEYREIQEKLKLAKLRDQFRLELPQLSVRPADISQALLDTEPQIVHFSGHGTKDGALCFENKIGEARLVQPEALAALFEQFTDQVDCVVLNACYSEAQANAIAEHIDYVVGMNQAIGDKAAIAFAVGFYQALGAGRTIEDAYNFGCVQIQLQDIPEHLTPVLLKNERDPAKPQSVKLEITPTELLENICPHISVVVKNIENKTVFCKVESHGIRNSSGEDIKRSVSSYANHFSWAGGSNRGTKEIPPNLDGIINLAKVNKRGYGIAFLFDENPHSYWKAEGTYKLDLMIVGEFEGNSSRMKSVSQRVMVEFAYIKKETQNSFGEVVNNSELRLLTWRLIDTD